MQIESSSNLSTEEIAYQKTFEIANTLKREIIRKELAQESSFIRL